MAVTTRHLLTAPVAVPLRIGGAFRTRFARLVRGLAGWAAAAQLGTDHEKEIGRKTGARV